MWLRPVAALTFGLCPAMLALAMSCDRGATGEEACRQIEAKRCELGVECPTTESFPPVDNVEGCALFYRDQCLFGIANDSINADPDEGLVNACLAALDQTAACKLPDPGLIRECANPVPHDPDVLCAALGIVPPAVCDRTGASACQLLAHPQALDGCAFLRPAAQPGTGGAGGTTAASGGSGGTAGTAGAGG